MQRFVLCLILLLIGAGDSSGQVPPRLNIYHFDVNTGDATLILSPDGHAVLIDAGNRGRGINPIKEFLDRARADGHLESLDYVITSHYDADHIGGIDELLNGGWYPEIQVYDRGDTLLPSFDREYVEATCRDIDVDEAEGIALWGTAPASSCPPSSRRASCQIVEYFVAAERGGKRATLLPGDLLQLDHGLEIEALVVNAEDLDGEKVDVEFAGRRDDCAANDLSIGLLVKYGDFRYLTAGDLTGDETQGVADVEELIKDDALDVDVYRVNHHGSETSSSSDFMEAIRPRVAVVSNGRSFGHPRRTVIEDRVLSLAEAPAVYLTNSNPDPLSWQAAEESVADADYEGYDGIVEIAVWRRSYRVFRWRDGNRIGAGDRYFIKARD